MANEIPDLWGDDIDVDVVPPHVILKTQAEAISRRTKGLLTASVTEDFQKDSEGKTSWFFSLILNAPSLGYDEELLELSHDDKHLYPVRLTMLSGIASSRTCNNQPELLTALAEALTSPTTKAVIASLLARVNESLHTKNRPVTPAGT
jgi:hypothetical protein